MSGETFEPALSDAAKIQGVREIQLILGHDSDLDTFRERYGKDIKVLLGLDKLTIKDMTRPPFVIHDKAGEGDDINIFFE